MSVSKETKIIRVERVLVNEYVIRIDESTALALSCVLDKVSGSPTDSSRGILTNVLGRDLKTALDLTDTKHAFDAAEGTIKIVKHITRDDFTIFYR